jgi:tRNA (cytidine/uridine-2'-O-)-methyltransferase
MSDPTARAIGDDSELIRRFDSPEPSRPKMTMGGYEALGLEFLLYALQSPINIGIILRVAEVYQFKVSVVDSHGVLDDPQKRYTIEDFACGAISRRALERLDPLTSFRKRGGRRLVATSIGPNALPLSQFCFRSGDVIALGNEYDGLPDELVAGADILLHIPTPAAWLPKDRSHSPIDPVRTASVSRQGQPSLNVAITAGILACAAYSQWLAKPEPETVAAAMSGH